MPGAAFFGVSPQVVTFSESGNFSAAGGAGKKRKRDEAAEDAMKIERSAYLVGISLLECERNNASIAAPSTVGVTRIHCGTSRACLFCMCHLAVGGYQQSARCRHGALACAQAPQGV